MNVEETYCLPPLVVAEIVNLRAEIERLQKQVDIQRLNLQLREIDGSMDVDKMIRDAERYRWLRHAIFNNPQNISPFPEKEIERLIANGMSEEDSLDYAIDAAMEGGDT